MDRVGAFLAGIVFILMGIGIMHKPRYIEPVFGGLVDFTGYEIPFGLVWIAIGAYCIWIGLTTKRNSGKGGGPD
jgi:uncharacterized protein YjeT (DUF2065 family)